MVREGESFVHDDSKTQTSTEIPVPDGHILVHAMGRTKDNGDIVDMFWEAADQRRYNIGRDR